MINNDTQDDFNSFIETSYNNPFGIDLKKFHKSKKPRYKNEKKLIQEINKNNRVQFADGISENFKLINHNGLNFLLGDKSVYPCSEIIRIGKGMNWVMCYAFPISGKIFNESDVRKSGIVLNYFNEIISKFQSEIDFRAFQKAVEFSYSENSWFDKNNFIISNYRKVKFWNKKQKIDFIFSDAVVSPRKYLTYLLFKNENLKTEKIVHSLFRNLASTTRLVINDEEFVNFIHQMSIDEIEDFFCLNYLRDHTIIEKITYATLGDMLNVNSGYQRRYIDWDKKIYKQDDVKHNFYSHLKSNIRSLENHIRMEKGFDEVGSYVMEKHLLNLIVLEFPNYTIIHQYSPEWLEGQRFDVFIKDLNIAIEYNGIQHFEEVDFFGGAEGLIKTKKLDLKKREKSLKNGVKIFDINYNEHFESKFNEIILLIKKSTKLN